MTTSIGSILSGEGKVFANGHGSVERVILKKGGKIERHNHPGKDVLVCVLRGNLNVVLDDSEKHALHAGDTLVFAGKHFTHSGVEIIQSHVLSGQRLNFFV